MSVVKAERFTALKAKVKAEMLRRNQSGSVASYGGAAYDYTTAPAAGRTVRKEHRDKLIEPGGQQRCDPGGQGRHQRERAGKPGDPRRCVGGQVHH